MSKSLTIALTTYNRPNYLSKAIKSVLNQTFKDFDLIILDNGSSQDTRHVVDTFKDSRIKYVRNESNDLKFVNKAFDYVQNDFLMIFHDDDTMNPNMLETLIKIIKSDSAVISISSSINLIDADSKNLNKLRPRILKDKIWNKNEFIQEYIYRGDIIPCPSTIFRSSVIKKHKLRYNWDVGPAVDLYLFFQINLLKGKMILLKKPLLNYRIHKDQGSERNRISLEYQVRPYIIKLLIDNNLLKYIEKYKQASLGIILQISLNNFLSGLINLKELNKELNKLINEGLKVNYLSMYWALIGITRGIKNSLFR